MSFDSVFRASRGPLPHDTSLASAHITRRVMSHFRGGFRDKEARPYNPNVVRLGSEEALSAAAQEVCGCVGLAAPCLLLASPRARVRVCVAVG
jgi:hypothetical protein